MGLFDGPNCGKQVAVVTGVIVRQAANRLLAQGAAVTGLVAAEPADLVLPVAETRVLWRRVTTQQRGLHRGVIKRDIPGRESTSCHTQENKEKSHRAGVLRIFVLVKIRLARQSIGSPTTLLWGGLALSEATDCDEPLSSAAADCRPQWCRAVFRGASARPGDGRDLGIRQDTAAVEGLRGAISSPSLPSCLRPWSPRIRPIFHPTQYTAP